LTYFFSFLGGLGKKCYDINSLKRQMP